MPWCAALGIAVLFAAELALHHIASSAVTTYPAYMRLLPVHEIGEDHRWPAWISAALVAVACGQTALLAVLFRRSTAIAAAPSLVAAVAIGACAMFAATTTTEDPWAYVGYAKMDTFAHAYAPPPHAFAPPFDVIEEIWHRPMTACDYGPLWLQFDRLLLRPANDLRGALETLRFAGVAELAALFALLGKLGISLRTRLLVALNPALATEFVVNAHNDLLGVLIVVAAMVAARRWLIVGVAVAGCAALVKVTFVFVAIGAIAVGMTRRRRIAAAAGIIAVAAAGSLLGGSGYLHALLAEARVGAHRGGGESAAGSLVLQGAVALLALAALVASAFADRRVGAAAWSFGALSTRFYASYAIWGLPYALLSGRYAAAFLIALPVVDVMLNFAFPGSGTLTRVIILGYVAVAGGMALGRAGSESAARPIA